MGARRLDTRLKAFRDEHIKIEMVPLIFGVADIWAKNLDSKLQVVSEVIDVNEFPMRYVLVYGTIFTKFDRKMASDLEEILNFEQLQRQSKKVLERTLSLEPMIVEKMRCFSPMKNMHINDEYKVSKNSSHLKLY